MLFLILTCKLKYCFKIIDIDNNYLTDPIDNISNKLRNSIIFRNSFNIQINKTTNLNSHFNNREENISQYLNSASFNSTIKGDTSDLITIASSNDLFSNLIENIFFLSDNLITVYNSLF